MTEKKSIKNNWPIASLSICGLNLIVFIWERHAMKYGLMSFLVQDYAFSWTQFLSQPLQTLPTFISHTFFHANDIHVITNLIFFFMFAPAVEAVLGSVLFFILYFVWGVAAACVQGFFSPYSAGLIGASGAISGAAGAFFVLYPLKFPHGFLSFLVGKWIEKTPSFLIIGAWYLAELVQAFVFLTPHALMGEVTLIAHWAHIGGFVAGAVSMLPIIM